MLSSDLIAALNQRPDSDVQVQVGDSLISVDVVEYREAAEKIILRLDPVALTDELDITAEDAVAQVPTWRMHVRATYAALIAGGAKTVKVRAGHHGRRDLAAGHLILFDTDHPAHPSILVYVQRVARYPSIAKLLDHEDPTAIAGVDATRDHVTAVLSEIYPEPLPAYLAIEVSLLNPVPADRCRSDWSCRDRRMTEPGGGNVMSSCAVGRAMGRCPAEPRHGGCGSAGRCLDGGARTGKRCPSRLS